MKINISIACRIGLGTLFLERPIDATPPTAVTLALAADTGVSNDLITSNRTVVVSGLEAGASWMYYVNGSAGVAGTGSSFLLPTGDGAKNESSAIRSYRTPTSPMSAAMLRCRA